MFVRNLPFKCTGEEVYKIFSRYGSIRQVRLGNGKNTKGTAFVVFHDLANARRAFDELSGFNIEGRYLVVLYFHATQKRQIGSAIDAKRQQVDELRQQIQL